MTSTQLRNSLVGPLAFEELRRMILGEVHTPPECFAEPAFHRLASVLHAHWGEASDRPSVLDLAVLVRQALRYHGLRIGGSLSLLIPHRNGWPALFDWRRVGMDAQEELEGIRVSALPWAPNWLANVGRGGVDASAVQEAERRQIPLVPLPVEPFAARFGRDRYRSVGQRSAIRAALAAPPGSTLLISLPTGDGKSFIFQTIAGMGYNGGRSGTTIVVVPTVALGLDHERSAMELGFEGPLAYRGGSTDDRNQQILAGIADGTQQLCFASPEALCGPMRRSLLEAAKLGHLAALVVDEAHLIETWGNNFRSDFQVLAGLRRTLLNAAGATPLRTILLSATATAQSISTLKTLFGAGIDGAESSFGIFSAAYLRPEVEYWVPQDLNADLRDERVLESLLHAPRPAILYVTERAEAYRWLDRLKQEGFARVAAMTGDTEREDRQRVIDGWCRGSIDLVVGTSAFGMGIDNAHVRSVVHACVPETLDRFYQEVGRGGRDGRASLSIIIPTAADIKTARSLNNPRVITTGVGFERWSAMFNHPASNYDPKSNTHLLRLDAAPGVNEDRIDMISDRSTAWNVRTLTLMAGAGMISLMSPETTAEVTMMAGGAAVEATQYHLYQRVIIHEPLHMDAAIWEARVAAQREKLIAAGRANLDGMLRFLRGTDCVANLIGPLYEVPDIQLGSRCVQIKVARACGGCPHCRASGRSVRHDLPLATPFPWSPPERVSGPGAQLLDDGNRVVITYASPFWRGSQRERRRFLESLAVLMKLSAIHNIIAPQGSGLDATELQKYCQGWPLFLSDQLQWPDLPPGPAIVLVPPEVSLRSQHLQSRRSDDARFLFVHEQAEAPDAPGVKLRERHTGRVLTLEQFQRQV